MKNNSTYETELQQQRESHKIEHQAEFKKWAKKNKIQLIDEMNGFKVGQKVTYMNSYGVKWEGHTIMGFEQPDKYGNCVYLDTDCYWSSKKLHEISIEA